MSVFFGRVLSGARRVWRRGHAVQQIARYYVKPKKKGIGGSTQAWLTLSGVVVVIIGGTIYYLGERSNQWHRYSEIHLCVHGYCRVGKPEEQIEGMHMVITLFGRICIKRSVLLFLDTYWWLYTIVLCRSQTSTLMVSWECVQNKKVTCLGAKEVFCFEYIRAIAPSPASLV